MVDDWTATRDTLHMWAQIVGKIRMVHMPLINHWWEVTLYVSPRGLTTGAVPYRDGVFDIEFDFVSHMLAIRHSDGGQNTVPCLPGLGETAAVADHRYRARQDHHSGDYDDRIFGQSRR